MKLERSVPMVFVCWGLVIAGCAGGSGRDGADAKISITTKSEEALARYLEGRDLQEKLRFTDAREYYLEAVEADRDFALAHLALANTAPTAGEFFESLERAVSLADDVSEGERDIILGAAAGVRGRPDEQRERYRRLVESFPEDERAHALLGGYHFGRQEYGAAIAEYARATEINPGFSPAYNSLGYAHRFLDQYDEAEQAFRRYIELIPQEPNPYDSYAELLMKVGRFEESIANYEKALSLDPEFVASYVGIGNNHIFLGRTDEARETFGKLSDIARNEGERRQAHFWIATSYLHDGDHARALDELREMYRRADERGDFNTMSGDLVVMGDVLLESGEVEEALVMFAKAVEIGDRADVPQEVKEATRRNHLFNEGRAALAKNDLETARARSRVYREQVEEMQIPFEVRQSHELAGMLAMAEGDPQTAIAELERANQRSPRVLYLLALACRRGGDLERARELGDRAAHFNALDIDYAFVKDKATRLLVDLG